MLILEVTFDMKISGSESNCSGITLMAKDYVPLKYLSLIVI